MDTKISLSILANILNSREPSLRLSNARDLSIFISKIPRYKISYRYRILEKYKKFDKTVGEKMEGKEELFKNQFIYPFYKKKKSGGIRRLVKYDPYLMRILKPLLGYLQELIDPHLPGYLVGSRPGYSIYTTANELAEHLSDKGIVGHLDICHWFDSIQMLDIKLYLESWFTKEAVNVLAELLTYHGRLPQGNPCSPLIANLVASSTWGDNLYEYLVTNSLFGKIYLDDIIIICNGNYQECQGHLDKISQIIKNYGFHTHKQYMLGPGKSQRILGLVTNRSGGQPRPPKRMRKLVKALIDKAEKGNKEVALEWAKRNKIENLPLLVIKNKFYGWLMGQIGWIEQGQRDKLKEKAKVLFDPLR